MAFDLDFDEEGKILFHIKKFLLYPVFWKDPTNQFPINLKWKSLEFKETNKSKIPKEKGLYAFVLIPEYNNFFETKYLFYAGKTNRTLRERFSEYLREKAGKGKPRKKIFKMLNQYDEHMHFFYTEIPNSADVDICEEKLLNTFVPHINSQIPKAKIKPELKNIYEN